MPQLCFVGQIAREKARCDYGLFMGASATNAADIPALASDACALKMYLNETYTTLRMDSMNEWIQVNSDSHRHKDNLQFVQF